MAQAAKETAKEVPSNVIELPKGAKTDAKSEAETAVPAPPSPPVAIDLNSAELYINRELSTLRFNRRVLEHAADARAPLLERLRFLTICSTNLDEFFEIRVAGVREQIALGIPQTGPDALTPQAILDQIALETHELVGDQYKLLNEQLLPALAAEGIHLRNTSNWSDAVGEWARQYFNREVLPVLTPIGLDPAHPFPRIQNKSLNFIVALEGKDAFGRSSRIAAIHVPRLLPRLVGVPPELCKNGHSDFILLTTLIQAYAEELFPGMKVKGCYAFRVTRDSDLWVDEEEVDDLLHALRGELSQREYGQTVRLEVSSQCPDDMVSFLLQQFKLNARDVYRSDGPVNLHRLARIYELVDRPALKYPDFVPALPKSLGRKPDLFEVLRTGDLVLHHPFESFAPVLELLRQAAEDPDVLAIKMTLYRTGANSPVVKHLIDAARARKEVTVVIELRARFDEAANIDLATRLQDAGAQVVYGIVGYKAHAKMMLVVRREGRKLNRYAHLGTGNYHTGTTRTYTDIGFLTSDSQIAEDVNRLFHQLTGLGKATKLKKLVQSPFSLQKLIISQIDREIEEAKAGKKARVIGKMNALADPEVIRALYRASQAGVQVDLLVRGVCCLRPGVPGVSDNITVRSIVGRFLEHSRVFYFHAGGEELLFCGSADWMVRNLARRVEVVFPVSNPEHRARLVEECFKVYLADNSQAWDLKADGSYKRVKLPVDPANIREAQAILLKKLTEG